MALVMTVRYGNAIVRVHDDAYRNCTPAEIAERKRKIDQVVSDILSVPENRARLGDVNGGWKARVAAERAAGRYETIQE